MNTIVVEKRLEIPSDELKRWEKLLATECLDYDELGFAELQNVKKWTLELGDGFEIDFKINSNNWEDGDLYSEAVLFDKDGKQVSFTDAQYDLEGEWNLYRTDENGNEINYHVVVCGV